MRRLGPRSDWHFPRGCAQADGPFRSVSVALSVGSTDAPDQMSIELPPMLSILALMVG
jgi:hypothetical protein